LEQESTRCRNSLIKEGYDVEYIQHTEKSENTKEIESKEKELLELMDEGRKLTKQIRTLKSEIDSKNFDESQKTLKREEIKKLENKLDKIERDIRMLKKDIENIKKIEKKYHIIKLKHKDIIPIPIPIPKPTVLDISSEAEVSATLSNTFKVREAIAERKAGEQVREDWKKTIWRNVPKKLNLFLRRKPIKDGYTKKYLNYTDRGKTGNLNRDTDSVAAADRHEIEEQEKFNDKIENIVGTMAGIENDYPNTHKAIVALAQRFI